MYFQMKIFYFTLQNWSTFKKHMLVVEIDIKVHVDRDPDYKRKRWKDLKSLVIPYFIMIKYILMIMKSFVKEVLTLLNQLKNKLRNRLKNN